MTIPLATKLMNMKDEIEKAKLEKARLQGQKDNLYKQLKNDFSCTDSTQAQRKLDKMGKDIDHMESALEKAVNKLDEAYVWNTL